MQASERWGGGGNPSARLRAVRSMPHWMETRSGLPTPPPPPPVPEPLNDPDYEVIDLPGQDYSNTIPNTIEVRVKRCELCGASGPSVLCDQCPQQSFCPSCDEMYHRHPKRQAHVRRAIANALRPGEPPRPPLPPKGEAAASSAPVPPPRKNKKNLLPPGSSSTLKRETGFVGSIKRIISGGKTLPPPRPPSLSRDRSASLMNNNIEFPRGQMVMDEMDVSGWARQGRVGSMSALNMPPAFGPLMHAQSMAQVGCPSCWGWGSQAALHQVGMHGPHGPHGAHPMAGGMMAPQPFWYPSWDPRRPRRHHRAPADSSTDEEQHLSPALSRRSFRPLDSDSDESFRKSRPPSRRESLADLRRRDEDTQSMRGGRYEEDVRSLRGLRRDSLRRREEVSDRDVRRSKRFDDTVSERGGVTRRGDDMVSERDGVVRRGDDTVSERGGVTRRRDYMVSERGGVVRREDDAVSERGGVARRVDDTGSERGGAARRVDDTVSERGGVARRVGDTASERDGVARRVDDTVSERSGAARRVDDTVSERSGAARRVDDTVSERSGAARRVDDTVSERSGAARRVDDTVSERSGAARRVDDTVSERSGAARRVNGAMSERNGVARRVDNTGSERSNVRRRQEDLLNEDRRLRRREEEKLTERGSRRLSETKYRDDDSWERSSRTSDRSDKNYHQDPAWVKQVDKKRDRLAVDSESERMTRSAATKKQDRLQEPPNTKDGRKNAPSPTKSVETTSSLISSASGEGKATSNKDRVFSDTGQRRRATFDSKREQAVSKEPEPPATGDPDNGETEEDMKPLGPIPTEEWECRHCTYVNPPGIRVCEVCCKTRTLADESTGDEEAVDLRLAEPEVLAEPRTEPVRHEPVLAEQQTEPLVAPSNGAPSKKPVNLSSKGTSPPPQSISTQTYDVAGLGVKKISPEMGWSSPRRSFSRQSVVSDTAQSGASPPRSRSPGDTDSQATDPRQPRRTELPSTLSRKVAKGSWVSSQQGNSMVQKQVSQGLEMVKLLREAEEVGFSGEEVSVAVEHCGDGSPLQWLLENWTHMIDTVVTLATNYGHERKENTIGTVSEREARAALITHQGSVWSAVTQVVQERQNKYGELLSRGNFSREDIVTALTAHRGDLEAAYTELTKGQLKPFLRRMWAPNSHIGTANHFTH